MNISECKGILIDFDGTLFDSLPALYQTYYEFLEVSGYEGNSNEFRRLNGLSLKEIVTVLKKTYSLKESHVEKLELYQRLLKKNYHIELKIFPGVNEFFMQVRKKHLRLAVVSSGNSDFINRMLDAENIARHFSAIITPQGNEEGKPAPDLYLRALAVLALKPQEAIAIEDAPLGVEAALAAGISTFQITHGETVNAQKGVKVVKNWEEITKVFAK